MDIPQLKIFLSSSMNPGEDDFNWMEFRKELYDRIKEEKFFDPEKIEDNASGFSPTIHQENLVRKNDMVIVLIRDTVREGTFDEIKTALENHNRLLVFFDKACEIHDGSVDDVKRLLRNKVNYVSKNFIPTKNFADEVVKNIYHDVIGCVQNTIYQKRLTLSNSYDDISLLQHQNEYLPTKLRIQDFSGSYSYLCKQLGISVFGDSEVQGKFCVIGNKVVDWIITGMSSFDGEDVDLLLQTLFLTREERVCLQERLYTVQAALSGRFQDAFTHAKTALEFSEKCPNFSNIKRDIILDLRNLENMIASSSGNFIINSQYQKLLNEFPSNLQMPVLDRYKLNVYEDLIKEDIEINTMPYGATRFGGNVSIAISAWANALFSAILYGSYSHISVLRVLLARMLYKYGEIYRDESLFRISMRLYILAGDIKAFKNIFNHDFKSMSKTLIGDAKIYWNLVQNSDFSNKEKLKLEVMATVGMYLNDCDFKDVTSQLTSIGNNVSFNNASEFINTVDILLSRLNIIDIINPLIKIIENCYFASAFKLTRLLMRIDISLLPETTRKHLHAAVFDNFDKIKNANGDMVFISALAKYDESFSDLLSLTTNSVSPLESEYCDINLGKGSWESILKAEIEEAKKQFDVSKKSNGILHFGLNPFKDISRIVNEQYSKTTEKIVISSFLPFSIEVLRNEKPFELLGELKFCVATCLAKLKSVKQQEYEKYCEKMKGYSPVNYFYSGLYSSSQNQEIIFDSLLRYIIGENDDVIMQWCINYKDMNDDNRDAVSQAVAMLSRNHISISDSLLLVLAIECSTDMLPQARRNACEGLAYLSKYYFENCSEALLKLSQDDSAYVIDMLLYLIEQETIIDKELAIRILKNTTNAPHYIIRKKALELQLKYFVN